MRTSEPVFGCHFLPSRQIVPRLSTSNEPSPVNCMATGALNPLANVAAFAGAAGSSAFIQLSDQSAKKNLPRHFSGNNSVVLPGGTVGGQKEPPTVQAP